MKGLVITISIVSLGLLLVFSGSALATENPCDVNHDETVASFNPCNLNEESHGVKVVKFYGCTSDVMSQTTEIAAYNPFDLNEEYTLIAGAE